MQCKMLVDIPQFILYFFKVGATLAFAYYKCIYRDLSLLTASSTLYKVYYIVYLGFINICRGIFGNCVYKDKFNRYTAIQ